MDKIDFFKTLKTNKDKVEMLLIKHPTLRDNDNKLIATFWFKQLGDSIDNMQGYDLLKHFANGNLTNTETIRRIRQKIQQTTPDLRGFNYNKRRDAGDDVSNQINDL